MKRFFTIMTIFLFFTCLVFLIQYEGPIAHGIQAGMLLAAGSLLPAMIPFMLVSDIMVRSGLIYTVSRPFRKLVEALFRLPGDCGASILISMAPNWRRRC